MSIERVLASLDGVRLFRVPASFSNGEGARVVYASSDVAEMISGDWPDTRDGQMHAAARAVLEAFVDGGYVTIAADPFRKAATALLARVHPVADEVWDFRCLDPRPGIRVLGSFAATDVFVALTWDYRENFDKDWPAHVAECKREWRRLFGDVPPFRGKTLNDYVSENIRAV
jgi:hypothetical protein